MGAHRKPSPPTTKERLRDLVLLARLRATAAMHTVETLTEAEAGRYLASLESQGALAMQAGGATVPAFVGALETALRDVIEHRSRGTCAMGKVPA